MRLFNISASRVTQFFACVAIGAALTGCESLNDNTPAVPSFDRSALFPNGFNPSQDVAAVLVLPTQSHEENLKRTAEQFKNAAEMALKDGAGNVKLAILSTDETKESTVDAVQKAVKGGADVVLGPLLSESVKASTPVLMQAGIAAVAFSNDVDAADSRATFLLGHLPQQETTAVVHYAAKHGVQRFYALLPDTIYGRRAGKAFNEAVQEQGATPVKVWYYRGGESLPNISSLLADNGKCAVFVPMPEDALRAVLPRLQSKKKKNVMVLGNGMWHKNALLRSPLAEGVIFAAPHPRVMEAFRSRYARTYHAQPTPTAALGYDAVRMAIALSLNTAATPRDRLNIAGITRNSGFAGITGTFRFLPTGLSERMPTIVTIKAGKPVVLQAAPESF